MGVTLTPLPSVYPSPPVWTGPLPTPDYSQVPERQVAGPSQQQLNDLFAPAKLSYELRQLAAAQQAGAVTAADREAFRIEPGDQLVVLVVTDPGQAAAAATTIRGLGGRIDFEADDRLAARIPLSALPQLEHIPTIRQVQRAAFPTAR